MATLAEVKQHAAAHAARGAPVPALRLLAAAVAAAPLDFEARLKLADCLAAAGEPALAIEAYRAVGRYVIKAGHPLVAVVAARVIESLGGDADDLLASLVAHYGSESSLVGNFAARINLPSASTAVVVPDLAGPPPPDLAARAAERAIGATADFTDWPEAVHAIPLLSQLSEAAFRRVLGTLVVRRLPDRAAVIREGEMGQSFFFVASGAVRVFDTDVNGRQKDLAQLRENAIFGEMALLSARPRSASVETTGEADLLEVTRASLAALESVATALAGFTQQRLIGNAMAQSPLFRPFTRAQQRDLLRRFTVHDVAPGTPIIRQGDEGRGLFLVLSGEVEVARDQGAGPTPLATLRTGDVFGEMALVAGGETTASVTAAAPTTVLFLAKEYVDRIVAGVPEIRAYLAALAEDRALDTQLALAADPAADGDDGIVIFF